MSQRVDAKIKTLPLVDFEAKVDRTRQSMELCGSTAQSSAQKLQTGVERVEEAAQRINQLKLPRISFGWTVLWVVIGAQGHLRKVHAAKLRQAHRNAQRLLQTLPVHNPFARRLTFPDENTRLRRDQKKYLTLIRAIALLHQHQRSRHKVHASSTSKSPLKTSLRRTV